MRIWKMLGWDTKEARNERNLTNNNHSTVKWAMGCVVALVAIYLFTQT
jgi:hypothetical protein